MTAPNPDSVRGYGPCHPEGWGQRVAGRCPSCGTSSLFVAAGQHITCGLIECPNPTKVADFLLGEVDVLRRSTRAQIDGSGSTTPNPPTDA